MRLVFTKYEGNDSDLSSKDKALLSPSEDSYIEIRISTPPKSVKMPTDVITTITLRELIADTFPQDHSFSNTAALNVQLTGHYPISTVIHTVDEDN